MSLPPFPLISIFLPSTWTAAVSEILCRSEEGSLTCRAHLSVDYHHHFKMNQSSYFILTSLVSILCPLCLLQGLMDDQIRSVAQSCPTLCDPMDCNPLGCSVHGIVQVRILEWVAMPSTRGSSPPRDQTCISCLLR